MLRGKRDAEGRAMFDAFMGKQAQYVIERDELCEACNILSGLKLIKKT